jgi:hypothetical protein
VDRCFVTFSGYDFVKVIVKVLAKCGESWDRFGVSVTGLWFHYKPRIKHLAFPTERKNVGILPNVFIF